MTDTVDGERADQRSAAPEPATPEWERLDHRTVLVTVLILIGVAVLAGVPTTVGLTAWRGIGFALAWVLPGAFLMIAVLAGADELRWRRTRYRVSSDTVELHRGILFLSRRRLARARIRAVDTSAHPVMRVFGLTRLTIGTGEQGGGGTDTETIVLEPVTRETGERLRGLLLNRDSSSGTDTNADDTERLATWRLAWVRYAPLSIATVIFVGAIVGVPFQVADWFGRGGLPVEVVRALIERHGVWPVIALGIPVIVIAAGIASAALNLEAWWSYRLDREPGGTLRVRRGLLTSRSLTLDEQRVRGIDLIEPLGVRLVGAARVQVVATGLSTEAEQKSELSTLLPAAPRALALEVAERVCGEAPSVLLTGHPVAARGRRLRWALITVAVLVAGWALLAGLTGWTTWWSITVGVLVALTTAALVARALDSYRNLGHALTERHLVTRHGSIRRSTVLLRRDGIIGWQVRQSVFQRRKGLATLIATTAAGKGRYAVTDADAGRALELAAEAVPDLIEPFLAASSDSGR